MNRVSTADDIIQADFVFVQEVVLNNNGHTDLYTQFIVSDIFEDSDQENGQNEANKDDDTVAGKDYGPEVDATVRSDSSNNH